MKDTGGLLSLRCRTLGLLIGALAGGALANGCGGSEGSVTNNTGPGTCFGAAGGGAEIGNAAGGPAVPVLQGTPVTAESPPPPISGGTLLMSHDGKTLIASDPDRDAIYVLDVDTTTLGVASAAGLTSALGTPTLRATIKLQAGDEPGRLVEDDQGRVHVALRSGGAVASIELASAKLLARTPVCDLPRGMAYRAETNSVVVACAEGHLVTLDADTQTISTNRMLERDLRDVVVTNDGLLVTKFRSAELLAVNDQGQMLQRSTPPTRKTLEQAPTCSPGRVVATFAASTAWRAMPLADGTIAVAHQRAREQEVATQPGGYGMGGCGTGIVDSVVSFMTTKGEAVGGMVSAPLFSMTLPVDLAVSSDSRWLAVVAPGNYARGQQVSAFTLDTLRTNSVVPEVDVHDLGGKPVCAFPDVSFSPIGQATAVAFLDPQHIAVQTREPASLEVFALDGSSYDAVATVPLSDVSRSDTGLAMFHTAASGGIACASCHPEAGDDGHVWTFTTIGPRRTQQLRGGLIGSEPFHWNGDMNSFDTLMEQVFVGRMGGTTTTVQQNNALEHWIDRQPALRAAPDDMGAVARGKTLFDSGSVGCAGCHNGALLTDNRTVDVGTGAALQVPSLHGLSFRAPFLHDGCADDLRARFGQCGGGDKHGKTSDLSEPQIDDLISYLNTL